jgi:hypothetical protein
MFDSGSSVLLPGDNKNMEEVRMLMVRGTIKLMNVSKGFCNFPFIII